MTAGHDPLGSRPAQPELLRDDQGLYLTTAQGGAVRAATAALTRPRRGRDLLGRAVKDALARAGTTAHEPQPEVLDATAGLGADAFHLAALGLEVTMVERVPQVAALLTDALAQAQAGRYGAAARAAAARLRLEQGEAAHALARRLTAGDPPGVVLLDPMYPGAGKSALPAKGMALFRDLVGADADAAELLNAALEAATLRVVVKRPLKAGYLAGLTPSGSLTGRTTRYDLYAPRRKLPAAE